MSKQKLAKLLSIVLGPHLWLPVLTLSTIFRTNLTHSQINILLPTLLILQVLLPSIYIYLALKFNKISAWDFPKKEERYPFLLIILMSSLVSLALIFKFGNDLLFNLNLIIFSLTIIISVTTYFWKISVHTSLNTAGSILINFLYDGKFPLIYLTIPAIFWARYNLERHNLGQLLAGVIISAAVVKGALYFLLATNH